MKRNSYLLSVLNFYKKITGLKDKNDNNPHPRYQPPQKLVNRRFLFFRNKLNVWRSEIKSLKKKIQDIEVFEFKSKNPKTVLMTTSSSISPKTVIETTAIFQIHRRKHETTTRFHPLQHEHNRAIILKINGSPQKFIQMTIMKNLRISTRSSSKKFNPSNSKFQKPVKRPLPQLTRH